MVSEHFKPPCFNNKSKHGILKQTFNVLEFLIIGIA